MKKPKRPTIRERAREWAANLRGMNMHYCSTALPDWSDVQAAWVSGYRAAQRDARRKGARG